MPSPDDPLVTGTGLIVRPDPYDPDKVLENAEKHKVEPHEYRANQKRNLKDLPAPIHEMNAIACVYMLTMLGIGDREIAVGLRIDGSELKKIRLHPAYGECFSIVFNELISVNSMMLEGRVAAYGQGALRQIGAIAMKGEGEGNRLRASIDLADRGDVRVQGAKERMTQNVLKIVVTDGGERGVGLELNGEKIGV